MSLKKIVLKDIFFYTITTLASQVMLVIKNCLVASILAPSNFGFWKFLQLLSEYGTVSSSWIIEGSRQKIPIYTAQRDQKNSYHIRDAAFTSTVLLSIFYCIASFVIYLFIFNPDFIRSKGFPTNLLWYLISINILIIFTIIYAFLWRYLSTINRFGEVSRIKIVVTIFDFILSVYLAYKFKVAGMIAAILITYIIAISIIFRKDEFRPAFIWDPKEMINLMYLGLPIFAISFIYQLLTSVDRIIILKFLDNRQLGLYGISLIAFNMFSLLSLPTSHVIYPRMIEEFSRSGFKFTESFKKYILIPVGILSYFIPPIIAVAYFFLPFIIAKFLPLYMPSLKPTMILIIGGSFIILMDIFAFAVITIRKYKVYFIVYFIVILVNALISLTLIKKGYGIEGVAFSSTISYCMLTTLVIYYVLSLFKINLFSKTFLIIRLYLPLLFSIFICILITRFISNFIPSGNLFFAFICLSIYFCAYLLFIYFCSGKRKIIFDLKWIIKETLLLLPIK